MSVLYDRRCVVIVGKPPGKGFAAELPNALRIEGLRVSFKIHKSNKPHPNTSEIAITNLSRASRGDIQGKGLRVILQAGYADNVGQIFSGDVRVADHVRQGSDWITKLQLGDGERAYQWARATKSYAAGVQVREVIRQTIAMLELDPGNSAEKLAGISGQFLHGYAQHGRASAELTRLLESRGYDWSIQDGRVEILGPEETLNGTVPRISQSSGLIGSPEHGTDKKRAGAGALKVKSLLRPDLRPGSKFEVQAEGIRGLLRVERLVHSGDTHSNDWFSEIEAVPTR